MRQGELSPDSPEVDSEIRNKHILDLIPPLLYLNYWYFLKSHSEHRKSIILTRLLGKIVHFKFIYLLAL